MRILLVNTYYYPNMIGGTEQSVKLLAEGLVNNGHEVFVLTGDKESKEHENINGVNVIRLDLMNKNKSAIHRLIRKGAEFNNIFIKKMLEEVIVNVNPQIIHTNNLFYISPIIWEIAKKQDVRVVHTLRDYWGLCPKTSLLDRETKICRKKKLLCNIHSKNYMHFSKNIDIVTAPSKFTIELYNKNGMFNNIKNVVVPNAIDININEYLDIVNKKQKSNNNKINFIYIGSLHEHKGVKYLIETFKEINNENIILNICGNGPLKDIVEEACKVDKRINYLGTVFGDKKEEILKKSDVMVIPSIWYEPFGRVVIEGYKYVLPVIACKIGGIKELLDENNSIGVEPASKVQLKSAIEKLSNRDNLQAYMKDSRNLLSKYDIKKQIEIFEDIYDFILK